MLLTADIGNTNIKFGIFNQGELIRTLTISCDKAKTADEYGVELYSLIRVMGIHRDDFDGCIISSVVPLITTRIDALARYPRRQFHHRRPRRQDGTEHLH